jgi:hypothetical protein
MGQIRSNPIGADAVPQRLCSKMPERQKANLLALERLVELTTNLARLDPDHSCQERWKALQPELDALADFARQVRRQGAPGLRQVVKRHFGRRPIQLADNAALDPGEPTLRGSLLSV